jgi:ABC-type lipoprotein release transport system permease subunit
MRCPPATYCSVHSFYSPGKLWQDKRGQGRCEQPIPVVLNPIVLDLFNMVLSSTLQRTELGTLDTLIGYEGSVTFGHSFYKETVKDRTPVEKRLLVVGFSNKALEAGVTMPMEYVKRANARYKGKRSAQEYDSVILQLAQAEKLPRVLDRMEEYNIQLSRRSAEAEKFRTVLIVAIAIFLILASVILGIAAINITHTFLMVIYERKREIGISRALGATKMDVRLQFLGESVLIGMAGGAVGNGLAFALSLLTDFLADQYLGQFPLKPDTFFAFQAPWLAGSLAFAIFFSIVGAFFPANRAAAMDPARTLTLP